MGFFSALFASLFFGGWSSAPLGRGIHAREGYFGVLEPLVIYRKVNPLQLRRHPRIMCYTEKLVFGKLLLRSAIRRSVSTVEALSTGGIGVSFGGYAQCVLVPLLVLALKTQLVCGAFVLARAALPRKRFDQLIQLCWKLLFPLAFALALCALGILYGMVLVHLWFDANTVGVTVATPAALELTAPSSFVKSAIERENATCDPEFGGTLYGVYGGNLEAMADAWIAKSNFETNLTGKQLTDFIILSLRWEAELCVREGDLTLEEFVDRLNPDLPDAPLP